MDLYFHFSIYPQLIIAPGKHNRQPSAAVQPSSAHIATIIRTHRNHHSKERPKKNQTIRQQSGTMMSASVLGKRRPPTQSVGTSIEWCDLAAHTVERRIFEACPLLQQLQVHAAQPLHRLRKEFSTLEDAVDACLKLPCKASRSKALYQWFQTYLLKTQVDGKDDKEWGMKCCNAVFLVKKYAQLCQCHVHPALLHKVAKVAWSKLLHITASAHAKGCFLPLRKPLIEFLNSLFETNRFFNPNVLLNLLNYEDQPKRSIHAIIGMYRVLMKRLDMAANALDQEEAGRINFTNILRKSQEIELLLAFLAKRNPSLAADASLQAQLRQVLTHIT